MKLNVYYDVKYAPVTFDFALYLVTANAVRQSIGYKTMGVTIVCDEFRNWSFREKSTERHEKRWRVDHILRKLPFLIPEVNVVTVTESNIAEIKFPAFPGGYPPPPGETIKFPYHGTTLQSFYKTDFNLRPYKASEQAKVIINNLFDDDVITIILRNAKYQPERNSNLDEWYKVYQELKNTKFRPIVIPCFEDYMGDRLFDNYDWEIFDPAVLDLDLRLALLEKAYDNLCINNGPNTLLIFSDCRYKYFKFHNEDVPVTKSEYHKEMLGISLGDNFPFAAESGQHMIWETDNADVILEALNL